MNIETGHMRFDEKQVGKVDGADAVLTIRPAGAPGTYTIEVHRCEYSVTCLMDATMLVKLKWTPKKIPMCTHHGELCNT